MSRTVGRVGALMIVAVVSLASAALADVDAERISGADRIGTAVAVAEAGWEAADVALVARADDFPDALAGGPLAAALDAPLLLTPRDELAPAVADALDGLGVSEVLLLGGIGALSGDVEAALATRGSVERIAGEDRYATAAAVAERAAREARAAGLESGEVIVASARSFPDALSAASLVAVDGTLPPIVLTEQGRLPAATESALGRLGADAATIVGGTAVVDEAVAAKLEDLGLGVERLAGSDRYATAARVLEEALARFGFEPRPLTVATGEQFPDALAAGPLAAAVDGPLAITRAERLPAAVAGVLEAGRDRIGRVQVVGGAAALSDDAVADVRRALGDTADDGDADGTRSDPHPVGASVAVGGEWELSVRDADPDATERVLAHNEFNDPPAAGHQFFTATVRMTYRGDAPVRSDAAYRLRAVGDEGVAYSTFADSCGVIPDAVDDRTVFAGGTIEGAVCWQVRSGDADSLLAFDADHDPRGYLALHGGPATDEPFPAPPEPAGTELGSRANPLAPGQVASLDDGWQLEVLGADRDATERVLAHNEFNDPPAAGRQFFIAEVEATYAGGDAPARFDGGYRLAAVGEAGAVGYRTFLDSCGSIPGALANPETYEGGTISGNVCWEIRSADADSLVVYDSDSAPDPFLAVP